MADGDWKKRYLQEKKKSRSLEKDCEQIQQEVKVADRTGVRKCRSTFSCQTDGCTELLSQY